MLSEKIATRIASSSRVRSYFNISAIAEEIHVVIRTTFSLAHFGERAFGYAYYYMCVHIHYAAIFSLLVVNTQRFGRTGRSVYVFTFDAV